jgi:hypothetical protein
MRHVVQPAGSNLCGQACVATILGISLKEAIKLVGTEGKTNTKQLVRALRKRGVMCKSKLTRGEPFYEAGDAYLVRTRSRDWKNEFHWCVVEVEPPPYHHAMFHDPVLPHADCYVRPGLYITSHLKVREWK